MLQTDRRTNPYPYTWEIPIGVLTVMLLIGAAGVHVGRGLAGVFAGDGWLWPPSRVLFTSLPAVLSGDPAAGLAGGTAVTAGPAAVTGWIITVEILVLAASITGLLWGLRRFGPNRMKGMAAAAEAESILGVTRLKKVAGIIRPDLYGARSTTTNRRGDHDGCYPNQ